MIQRFKIEKNRFGAYIIKRHVWLLPPFYEMRTMTQNEFFGNLNHYGESVLSREDATFKTYDQARDAIQVYAQIKGISEITLKRSF